MSTVTHSSSSTSVASARIARLGGPAPRQHLPDVDMGYEFQQIEQTTKRHVGEPMFFLFRQLMAAEFYATTFDFSPFKTATACRLPSRMHRNSWRLSVVLASTE